MQLKLKSNFFELWHTAFDSDGLEFRLISTEGPNRIEQHNLFRKIGLSTPLFGKYGLFLKNKFENHRKVVVYDDIQMHFGEGKRLVEFGELTSEDKLKWMCEYISTKEWISRYFPLLNLDNISCSTRYLFVGDYGFSYAYCSMNDWRSNNGRVTISEPQILEVPKWRNEISYPLFAIDFVGPINNLKAIDFNIAPGVSGIKLPISSTQMVLAIKTWLKKYVSD